MNPRILIALVLLCVFALGATVFAATRKDGAEEALSNGSAFAGAVMPEGLRAPDFDLKDQQGDPISMRRFRGKPVIVTFLYTNCRDTCPAQAQVVKGALAELGHPVPAIAVSVDPRNDSEESAKGFLSKQRVAGLDFVLGSQAELAPLWKGFAIRPQTITEEHQARMTLVDKRGFQRVGYPGSEATPERIAHDIALLERE